jgi:hypothetical protein
VIQIQTRHPTRTLQARDRGRGRPYAPRRLADTRLRARDPHLQGDAHEVRPTRDHHHQGVEGVLPIPQLRREIDQGVHLVVPGIRPRVHEIEKKDSR